MLLASSDFFHSGSVVKCSKSMPGIIETVTFENLLLPTHGAIDIVTLLLQNVTHRALDVATNAHQHRAFYGLALGNPVTNGTAHFALQFAAHLEELRVQMA